MQNNSIKKELESIIKEENTNADIKISIYDINKKTGIDVNGNKIGWSASIIKIPVMISVLNEIDKGMLTLNTSLKIDHKFTLEQGDFVSLLEDGTYMGVKDLLEYMIIDSDNEATNILADCIGGPRKINRDMHKLKLKKSMLGHLLCPNVPRYKNIFYNRNGSNITTPNDMVNVMRHIYDQKLNIISNKVKYTSDKILSLTSSGLVYDKRFKDHIIKTKIGFISDLEDGSDMNEVGIIDDNLIYCVMANKINREVICKSNPPYWMKETESMCYSNMSEIIKVRRVYDKFSKILADNFL